MIAPMFEKTVENYSQLGLKLPSLQLLQEFQGEPAKGIAGFNLAQARHQDQAIAGISLRGKRGMAIFNREGHTPKNDKGQQFRGDIVG